MHYFALFLHTHILCSSDFPFMPLDVRYRERYQGFFNETRSVAPKFSTASRSTMLTPYHYGGGYGTVPKAPHNVTCTDVGPVKCEAAKKHTQCAVFGTSRRNDLWGRRESSGEAPTANQSASRQRAVTPPSSRRSWDQQDQHCSQHSARPTTPTLAAMPSEFDISRLTNEEKRLLNARFARDGVHTPRAYLPNSHGGAIPRSSRKELFRPAETTPGPGAYRPMYGLVK